jgi:hypothetical protein
MSADTAESDCLSDEYRAEIKEYHKEKGAMFIFCKANKQTQHNYFSNIRR